MPFASWTQSFSYASRLCLSLQGMDAVARRETAHCHRCDTCDSGVTAAVCWHSRLRPPVPWRLRPPWRRRRCATRHPTKAGDVLQKWWKNPANDSNSEVGDVRSVRDSDLGLDEAEFSPFKQEAALWRQTNAQAVSGLRDERCGERLRTSVPAPHGRHVVLRSREPIDCLTHVTWVRRAFSVHQMILGSSPQARLKRLLPTSDAS